MAKGKSPGSDGLPMEFYVAFWELLGEDLVNVFNASLEAGLLPFSQRVFLLVVRVCLPRSPLVFFFCLSACVFPLFAPPPPSVAFVSSTAVYLGSELALLECACLHSRCSPRSLLLGCTVVSFLEMGSSECRLSVCVFSFLSLVYSLLYCI